MHASKLRSLISASLLLITSSFFCFAHHPQHQQQVLNRVADGTGPVPPYPPTQLSLMADGTGPVPPYPPTQLSLMSDVTGPVPPSPPIFLDVDLLVTVYSSSS